MSNWQGVALENIASELKNIREILEKQSTTEQSSMVGEWVKDEYDILHCNKCNCINNTVYRNYCPNCGAKMKGADNEFEAKD